jgi:hypothetical protein
MKIRPVGAELFHADRQTDMKKLIVACGNFANTPKDLTMYRRLHLFPSSVGTWEGGGLLTWAH